MLSRGAVMALPSASAVRRSSRSQSPDRTSENSETIRKLNPPSEFPEYSGPFLPLAPVRTRPEPASPRSPSGSPRRISFETTPSLEAAAFRPARDSRGPQGSPRPERLPASKATESERRPQQSSSPRDRQRPQNHSNDRVITLKGVNHTPSSPGFFSPLFSPRWMEPDDVSAATKQCELHIGNEPNVIMRLAVAKSGSTPLTTAAAPSNRRASFKEFPGASLTPRSPVSPFTPFTRLFTRERLRHGGKQSTEGIAASHMEEDSPKATSEGNSSGRALSHAVSLDQPLSTPTLTAVRSQARADPFTFFQQAQSSSISEKDGTACQIDVPRFVEVVIEVPKGSFVKHKADGTVDYMMFLPCPFNYGSVPAFDALDGDPQDALVLGPKIRKGETTSLRVEAMLKFTDAGMVDHKLVCTQRRPTAAEVPAPEKHRSNTYGLRGFGLLLSGFWWKRGSPSDPMLMGHEGVSMCTASCPGRCDTGIALPVAKVRASVKCALCGGVKPFPRTGGEASCSHKATIPRSISEPLQQQLVPQAASLGSRMSEGDLVQLNLSLPQFILVTGFFRFFATCKSVLNTLRGRKGPTRFAGWEVAKVPGAY